MSEPQKLRSVFVVDDEPVIASSLAMILRANGFDAKPFTHPQEALLATRTECPNLLISDVVMPQLSGIELAVQVLENCPNCKVLLFSGQAVTSDRRGGVRQNGHHFEVLPKPLHPADLLRKIESLTGESPSRRPASGVPGKGISSLSA